MAPLAARGWGVATLNMPSALRLALVRCPAQLALPATLWTSGLIPHQFAVRIIERAFLHYVEIVDRIGKMPLNPFCQIRVDGPTVMLSLEPVFEFPPHFGIIRIGDGFSREIGRSDFWLVYSTNDPPFGARL